MSLEPNNEIRLPAASADNPAGNQLVPYRPGRNQILPYTPKPTRLLPSADNPASRRYTLVLQAFSTKSANRNEMAEAAYNSNLCLVEPKTNQVGLLIDIYA